MSKAFCITFGEQSENHAGMEMYGNGLADRGYSITDLEKFKKCFEEKGGNTELIRLDEMKIEGEGDLDPAGVLILRGGVDLMINQDVPTNDDIFQELLNLDWDNKYWDNRRSRVLNKRARWNLCFTEGESIPPDYENKKGRVVGLIDTNLGLWKHYVEMFISNALGSVEKFECEGNYYYDTKKCGIGFHGDSERKKVVAGNFGESRKIVWIWYERSKRISERVEIEIQAGDMYVMSEKASGWDWKKRSKKTLRHAAGCMKYTK